VTWNDGKPFTGADVKFTFETGKLAGSELSTMWKTGLTNILVKGNTVSFVFKGKPNYLDWNTNIYSWGIVPQHVWKNYSADRDHDRATPTSTWSAPARSPTAPARARRARCSGTAVATGGRRRRSG
jgi:ABC-type transport system substrate-binding protein